MILKSLPPIFVKKSPGCCSFNEPTICNVITAIHKPKATASNLIVPGATLSHVVFVTVEDAFASVLKIPSHHLLDFSSPAQPEISVSSSLQASMVSTTV